MDDTESHCGDTNVPSRLEPAIEDLLDALEHASAFFRGDRNVVYLFAMYVRNAFDARQLLKLRYRADADDL